jgi:hypothetical protein
MERDRVLEQSDSDVGLPPDVSASGQYHLSQQMIHFSGRPSTDDPAKKQQSNSRTENPRSHHERKTSLTKFIKTEQSPPPPTAPKQKQGAQRTGQNKKIKSHSRSGSPVWQRGLPANYQVL